jgi:hypothetical protein
VAESIMLRHESLREFLLHDIIALVLATTLSATTTIPGLLPLEIRSNCSDDGNEIPMHGICQGNSPGSSRQSNTLNLQKNCCIRSTNSTQIYSEELEIHNAVYWIKKHLRGSASSGGGHETTCASRTNEWRALRCFTR